MTLKETLTALAAVAVVYHVLQRYRRRSGLQLPPGPPKRFLVGNLFDLAIESPWEAYTRWSRDYGSDVLYLDVAGKPIIILNSYESCYELFQRRSSLYSSRPHFPMLGTLFGFYFSFGLMPYGERWRTRRRLMYNTFNSANVQQFRPHLTESIHRLMRGLLEAPEDYASLMRLVTADVVISATYGFEVKSTEDQYVRLAESAMERFNHYALPGKYLADFLPSLVHLPTWFPGAKFKRVALEDRKKVDAMVNVPFDECIRRMEDSTGKTSFVSNMLQDKDLDPQLVKHVSGVIYAASVDTISASLLSFTLMMVLNRDTQLRARKELDSVVRHGSMPTFDDMIHLPYVTAIVHECLRFAPATPVGAPRLLEVEDSYKDFRLPAGSTVFANLWAMLRDEATYPDPHKWKPERFIDEFGKLNTNIRDPNTIAFGLGRRNCPGRYFAYQALWLTIACLLRVYDFSKEIDADGNEVEPSGEYLSELISAPVPFTCTIKPHSPEAEQLIRASAFHED